MSITDELREYVQGWRETPNLIDELDTGDIDGLLGDFEHIADCIDSEHERAMSRAGQLLADAEKDRDYNYANWQDCKQKVLQGNITFNELEAEIERLKDELLHCIELPKDADGEVIHVGDAMERGDAHGCVIALMLSNYPKKWGGGLHWSIQLEGEQAPTALDITFHHYHAPTVEDVLREFAAKLCIRDGFTEATEETFAEYAAKLRLREDA